MHDMKARLNEILSHKFEIPENPMNLHILFEEELEYFMVYLFGKSIISKLDLEELRKENGPTACSLENPIEPYRYHLIEYIEKHNTTYHNIGMGYTNGYDYIPHYTKI